MSSEVGKFQAKIKLLGDEVRYTRYDIRYTIYDITPNRIRDRHMNSAVMRYPSPSRTWRQSYIVYRISYIVDLLVIDNVRIVTDNVRKVTDGGG